MSDQDHQYFVEDGHDRARTAIEAKIRAEVQREYANQVNKASFWERQRRRREMDREVERRIDLVAPPDAVY